MEQTPLPKEITGAQVDSKFLAEMAERRAQALPSGTYPALPQVEAPDVFDQHTQVTAVDLVNAGV